MYHKNIATAGVRAHDGRMRFWLNILEGLSSGLRVQESPLYRYPYRNALEAFRGDAKRVAADIQAASESNDES